MSRQNSQVPTASAHCPAGWMLYRNDDEHSNTVTDRYDEASQIFMLCPTMIMTCTLTVFSCSEMWIIAMGVYLG
jgi:hypothetical protein